MLFFVNGNQAIANTSYKPRWYSDEGFPEFIQDSFCNLLSENDYVFEGHPVDGKLSYEKDSSVIVKHFLIKVTKIFKGYDELKLGTTVEIIHKNIIGHSLEDPDNMLSGIGPGFNLMMCKASDDEGKWGKQDIRKLEYTVDSGNVKSMTVHGVIDNTGGGDYQYKGPLNTYYKKYSHIEKLLKDCGIEHKKNR